MLIPKNVEFVGPKNEQWQKFDTFLDSLKIWKFENPWKFDSLDFGPRNFDLRENQVQMWIFFSRNYNSGGKKTQLNCQTSANFAKIGGQANTFVPLPFEPFKEWPELITPSMFIFMRMGGEWGNRGKMRKPWKNGKKGQMRKEMRENCRYLFLPLIDAPLQ